jgi:tRNA (adenine22-N1)-methyltransferase
MIKISKRLETVATLVEDNSKIIDIGCDHGLLDIYLVQTKDNIHIIASDLRENALRNAKNNIKKYNLDNKIETRLGNGLDIVESDEINTIIMSGLGTHTIVGILVNNLKKLKNVETIIIQSNNYIDFLRKKITSIGYFIANEKLVEDSGIIYTVIKFQKGKRYYRKKELYFGPVLLKENSKLFQKKKNQDLATLNKIYNSIPKNHLHHRLKIFFQIKLFK